MAMATAAKNLSKEERFENLKKEIRAILISADGPITPQRLNWDYFDINGRDIPYGEFGYYSLYNMLDNMPDAVKVYQGPKEIYLNVVSTNTTKRLESLISRQRHRSTVGHFGGITQKPPEECRGTQERRDFITQRLLKLFENRNGYLSYNTICERYETEYGERLDPDNEFRCPAKKMFDLKLYQYFDVKDGGNGAFWVKLKEAASGRPRSKSESSASVTAFLSGTAFGGFGALQPANPIAQRQQPVDSQTQVGLSGFEDKAVGLSGAPPSANTFRQRLVESQKSIFEEKAAGSNIFGNVVTEKSSVAITEEAMKKAKPPDCIPKRLPHSIIPKGRLMHLTNQPAAVAQPLMDAGGSHIAKPPDVIPKDSANAIAPKIIPVQSTKQPTAVVSAMMDAAGTSKETKESAKPPDCIPKYPTVAVAPKGILKQPKKESTPVVPSVVDAAERAKTPVSPAASTEILLASQRTQIMAAVSQPTKSRPKLIHSVEPGDPDRRSHIQSLFQKYSNGVELSVFNWAYFSLAGQNLLPPEQKCDGKTVLEMLKSGGIKFDTIEQGHGRSMVKGKAIKQILTYVAPKYSPTLRSRAAIMAATRKAKDDIELLHMDVGNKRRLDQGRTSEFETAAAALPICDGRSSSSQTTEVKPSSPLEKLKEECRMVLRAYPNGVMYLDFVKEYCSIVKKTLDIAPFGWFGLADMVDHMPDVFVLTNQKDGARLFECKPPVATQGGMDQVLSDAFEYEATERESFMNVIWEIIRTHEDECLPLRQIPLEYKRATGFAFPDINLELFGEELCEQNDLFYARYDGQNLIIYAEPALSSK